MTTLLALASWFHLAVNFLTVLIIFTSFEKGDYIKGDFNGYRVLMKNDLRSAISLYQDIIPASDYSKIRSKSQYLLDKKDLFNRAVSSIPKKNKIFSYYIKQAEHLLRLDNNCKFLKDKKNIKTSSSWAFESLFPIYYYIEDRIIADKYYKVYIYFPRRIFCIFLTLALGLSY